MTKSNQYAFLVLIFVTALIIFSNLGAVPLLDPDEPVYAETPQEMIMYGDLISPRIYGEYWYDKPPMYYWLVAASYQVFGVSDFAARFPSALLAVLCVMSVYFFTKKMINGRAALLSGLVLATSIEFFYLGKAAVTDITLTLCLTLSLFCFIRKKYYLFYAFAGLAVLTKGPIGLFFPGVIAFFFLLFTRNLAEIKRMKIFSGGLLFLAIASPWYLIMYQIHGFAFIDTFLGFHNVTRFTSPEHPSGVLWYYYLPVLCIGFFPWISVLFQAFYQALFRQCRYGREMLFFAVWAGVVFLFFSVSQTKLVSYILPMFPAMAVVVGWYIDLLWAQQHYYAKRQLGWAFSTAVLCILFGIGSFLGIEEMRVIEMSVYVLIGVLIFLMAGTIVFVWQKNIAGLFITQIFAMILLAATVSYGLFPAVAPYFSTKETAVQFEQIYDGKSEIYISKFLRPGFAFYSGYYGKEVYFSQTVTSDIDKMIAAQSKAYFVFRDIDYDRITESARAKLKVEKIVDNKLILSTQ